VAYRDADGTSMAAPHVTGLIAYLLAMDPDLTTAQVLTILRDTSRTAANVSPTIDAFAALRYIDDINETNAGKRKWVKKALLNVDDGTIDGNDRNVEADEHGSGIDPPNPPTWRIDMADFRRYRDAMLQILNRGTYLAGPAESLKRDLNGDEQILSPEEENIYPRFDFNGDRKATADDLAEMADPDLWNDEQIDDAGMSAGDMLAELQLLLSSGDIKLDPGTLFETEDITSIRVAAKSEIETGVYKSYALTLIATDVEGDDGDLRKVPTIPADKPTRIWATAYKGAERRFYVLAPDAPAEIEVQEGSDRELRLGKAEVKIWPERILARYDTNLEFEVRFEVDGVAVAMDPEFYEVAFTAPAGLGTISATANETYSGFDLATGSTPDRYIFQASVTNADGEIVNSVEQPQAIGEATVRTAIINQPGGLALDSVGNMYVTDSETGTVTFIPPGREGLVILDGLDKPGDVEVDARGRSLIVAQAEGKVGRYFFGLTGTVKNAAGERLTGAFVYVETPAGTIPGDATPENAIKTNEGGQFHVPDLLAPEMGWDPVEVVVTISYRGKDQAFPITLEPVGPTVEELVLE
jgi:hypothetical protein